jgi:hypothetical protein
LPIQEVTSFRRSPLIDKESIVSVSSIGSGAGDPVLALKLLADQKALAADQKSKASQTQLNADQAKIVADQQAVAASNKKHEAKTQAAAAGHAGSGTADSNGVDLEA